MTEKTVVLKTGKCAITQKYKSTSHKGIDMTSVNSNGTHICDYITAHSNGKVKTVVSSCNTTYKTGSSYGNYVIIEHEDGYSTLYAHLKYGSIKVRKGQQVKRGDVIGYMGNTGHSIGAHLHFEVRKDSTKIDPTPYLNKDLPKEKKHEKETEIKTVKATGVAKSKLSSISGTYIATDSLNIRNSAGTTSAILVTIPKGQQVKNYGYYTKLDGVKWLYVTFTYKGTNYIGFCSSKWLKKK